MNLPQDRALHPSTDRRDEFVGIVAAVLPRANQALETTAMYTLMAMLWGMIIYLALGVLTS
jgi:hypothetical protein